MARRRTTLQQRLTPCECCGYPISECHHLFEVAFFGENDYTAQLCANCHELYHLIESVVSTSRESQKKRERNSVLLSMILKEWGNEDKRYVYLCNLVYMAHKWSLVAWKKFGHMNVDKARAKKNSK